MSPLGYHAVELIVLGSGSSGNTALVRGEGTTILVDAGLSARKTLARLDIAGISVGEIDAVLLTHEHGDHTAGLPVLLRSLGCPVYATRLTADELRENNPRHAKTSWKVFGKGSPFSLGSFEITAFAVPHDAADPVGFTIRCGDLSLGILTDLGHVNSAIIEQIQEVDGLFVEANHDEEMLHTDTRRPFSIKQRILSPHGHLSNRAAADLASRVLSPRLRQIVLGHLSRDCNTAELAISVVRASLRQATSIEIHAAGQDEALPPVRLALTSDHRWPAANK